MLLQFHQHQSGSQTINSTSDPCTCSCSNHRWMSCVSTWHSMCLAMHCVGFCPVHIQDISPTTTGSVCCTYSSDQIKHIKCNYRASGIVRHESYSLRHLNSGKEVGANGLAGAPTSRSTNEPQASFEAGSYEDAADNILRCCYQFGSERRRPG